MSWTCNLASEAAEQLRRLLHDRRRQLARAIEELTEDPMQGDVRPIKSGKFKATLRKRVGRYRIIFSVDTSAHRIDIAAILPRTDNTYR